MLKWNHNYHTHTKFSDGKNTVKEMVESAIEKELITLGFSDHSPVPVKSDWNMRIEDVETYIKKIREVSKENKEIEIFTGIELDYLKGEKPLSKEWISQFDYTIGSLHYFKTAEKWEVIDKSKEDFKTIINTIFSGDIKKLFRENSIQQCEMIELYKPTILGHIDLITKFNAKGDLFNEEDKNFLHSIYDIIEMAKENDTIIEINTGAISRGYRELPYPSIPIIKRCRERGVRLTLNSDAHNRDGICGSFTTALEVAKECGVNELWRMKKFGGGAHQFVAEGI